MVPHALLRAAAPAAPDELSPAQCRGLAAGIVIAHGAVLWALLQSGAVHEAALQVAPVLVRLIAAPAPRAQPSPPMPDRPQPLPRPPSPPRPAVTAAPRSAPAVPSAPAPAPQPAAPVAATIELPAAAATPASSAAAPVPPAPKVLPASAVAYLEPPAPLYPQRSRRNGETGRVLLRAYIDASGGAPRSVEIQQSSGHARLDDAALVAVRQARFKPCSENGLPVAGWALIPILFELEP